MFCDERLLFDDVDASAVTYLPSVSFASGVRDDGLAGGIHGNTNSAAVPYDAAATSSDFLQDDEVAQGFGGDDDLWREFLRTLQDAPPGATGNGNDVDGEAQRLNVSVSSAVGTERSVRHGVSAAASFLLDDEDDPVLDPSFVVEDSVLAQQTDNMCYHVSEKELEALLEDNEMFVRELLDKPDNYAEQYFHHHIDQVCKTNATTKPAATEPDQEYLAKLISNLGAMYIQLLTYSYVRFYACKRSTLKVSCLLKLKRYFMKNGLGDPEAVSRKSDKADAADGMPLPDSPFARPANLKSAFVTVRFIAQLGRIAQTYSSQRNTRFLNVTRRLIFAMSGVVLYPRLADDRAQQAMLIVWAENWLIAAGLALHADETRPQSRVAEGVLLSMSSQQISRRVQNVVTRHDNQTSRSGKGHVNPIVAWKQNMKLPRFSRNLKDKLPVFGENTKSDVQPLIHLSPNLWPNWLQELLLSPPVVAASNADDANDARRDAAALEQPSGTRRSRRNRRQTNDDAATPADDLQFAKGFEWVQDFCASLSNHPEGYALSMLPISQQRIYEEFLKETRCLNETKSAGVAKNPAAVSKARYRAFIAEVDRFVRAHSDSDYRTHYTYMMMLKTLFVQRSFTMSDINRILACMGILRLIAWNDATGLLSLKLPAEFFTSNFSAVDNIADVNDAAKLKFFLRNFASMLSKTYFQRSENDTHHRKFSVFLQLCVFLVPATRHLQKFTPVIHQLIVNVRLLLNHVANSQADFNFSPESNKNGGCINAAERVRGVNHVMSMFTKTLFGEVGLSDLRHTEPFASDKKLSLLLRKFFPDAEVDDLLLPAASTRIIRNSLDVEYAGRSQSAAALMTRTLSEKTVGQENELLREQSVINRAPVLFLTDADVAVDESPATNIASLLARNELPAGFFSTLDYDKLGNESFAERDLIIKYALSASRAVDVDDGGGGGGGGDDNDVRALTDGETTSCRQQQRLHAAKLRKAVENQQNLSKMPAALSSFYKARSSGCLPLNEDIIYILSDDEVSNSTTDGEVETADVEENIGD